MIQQDGQNAILSYIRIPRLWGEVSFAAWLIGLRRFFIRSTLSLIVVPTQTKTRPDFRWDVAMEIVMWVYRGFDRGRGNGFHARIAGSGTSSRWRVWKVWHLILWPKLLKLPNNTDSRLYSYWLWRGNVSCRGLNAWRESEGSGISMALGRLGGWTHVLL